ncbi:MAG: SDR family oxidoreductase [Calditrichaeota bacterium]|nr:SDR family oxidoreductase [Calditrichota bacterium]MCB0269485.1 SDR family oxidoreductase [Calditrichota bacterium]MCB9066255.1 SDR family oxidoreductase [Calditrichia bacterium]
MTDGQTMAITGTSKGLGRAIAEFYLQKGFRVAGCSRSDATLAHDNYHHSAVDVTDEAAVARWIRTVKSHFGHIDVLICNAGSAPATLLLTMTPGKTLDNVLRTNVMGTFFAAREAAKVMMRQKSGRIITVSSMAVGLHQIGTSAYAASKSAIVETTKILAKELAEFGVTANVIAPSMVMTDAVDALGEAVIAKALNDLTLKRTLSIDEICNVITFLIAPESACITGQVLQMGLVS